MDSSTECALALFRDSLSEAQATVRAYDTKAQIVSVGYIFTLGLVSSIEDAIGRTDEVNFVYLLVAWGIVILPVFLFGFVLYPSRKTAPQLSGNITLNLQHILYIDSAKHSNVEDLIKAAERADPMHELAYELLKVSKLRELKRRRFLRGLFATGISFAVLFASEVYRSLML